jgi:regulatory protein
MHAQVTDVRVDPPHTPRRVIALDHDPWRVTSSAALKRVKVAVGDIVDPDELESSLAAVEHDLARRRALRLLARAERGSTELRRKLMSEGYSDALANDVVDSLVDAGLACDRRFADALAHMLTHSKRYGRRRVVAELGRRGLDETLVHDVVARFCAPASESARAAELAASLVARHSTFERLASALLRRGYDHDTAAQAARAQLRDRP